MFATISTRKTLVCAAVAGCMAAVSSSAMADFSDPFIRVTATNASGTGSFLVALGDVTINPDGSAFFATALTTINDGPTTIATITQLNTLVRPQSGGLPNLISLGFTFRAGSSDTTFTVESTLFGINPIIEEAGRTSAGVTITDQNGDGVSFSGNGADSRAFTTLYNGNTFANLIDSFSDGPAGSETRNDSNPGGGVYTALPNVDNMSARWDFTLSATDQVGVTSVWEVVPTPGAASLLALGGLVAARRRRTR